VTDVIEYQGEYADSGTNFLAEVAEMLPAVRQLPLYTFEVPKYLAAVAGISALQGQYVSCALGGELLGNQAVHSMILFAVALQGDLDGYTFANVCHKTFARLLARTTSQDKSACGAASCRPARFGSGHRRPTARYRLGHYTKRQKSYACMLDSAVAIAALVYFMKPQE
jgi:hypothetical protein